MSIPKLFHWVVLNWRSITLSRIGNFIAAYRRKLFRTDSEAVLIEEQVAWRKRLVETVSPECIKQGKCVHCGCETPDKFYETAPCANGCYPEWLNEEEWAIQKLMQHE